MEYIHRYKKIIVIAVSILLIICVAVSIYIWNSNRKANNAAAQVFNISNSESEQEENSNSVLSESAPESIPETSTIDFSNVQYMTTDFTGLTAQNLDTVGWIKVNGTKVNYPIVQTSDNDFYLNHSFDKSQKKAGWVFGDFRNNFETLDLNTILYGHDMSNNTMFGSLAFCLENWWSDNRNNQIIQLNTLYDQTLWQIFSVYIIPVETYYISTSFFDENELMKFLNTMRDRNQVKALADVTFTPNDKILTLSTCRSKSMRLVVTAKLVKATHNRIP